MANNKIYYSDKFIKDGGTSAQYLMADGSVSGIGGQGTTGPQGPTGSNGSNGSQGPAGSNGSNGSNGSQGPAGSNGSNGSNGSQGPAGSNGSNGSNGSQGPAGSNGSNGSQGPSGSNGGTGSQGPSGSNGGTGSQGPAGSNGSNGSNGSQGPAGSNGSNGSNGSQGPAGSNGSNGSQGPAGSNGSNGSNGSQGTTGPQGPAGSSGAGAVDGSGTANYIPKWSDTDTLTNSVIYENVGVGVNTTSSNHLSLSDFVIKAVNSTSQLMIIDDDSGAGNGPVFNIFRDSSTPAVSDNTGVINFLGNDSTGAGTVYSKIATSIESPSAGGTGNMIFHSTKNGSLLSPLTIQGNQVVLEGAIEVEENSTLSVEGTSTFRKAITNETTTLLKSIDLTTNEYRGDTVSFGTYNGGNGTVATGDVVVCLSGTNPTWARAKADEHLYTKGLIGIALNNSGTPVVLVRGFYDYGTGINAGATYHISTSSAGDVQAAVPSSSGDFLRVVGYGSTTGVLYVQPSATFIEIA